MSEFTIKIDAGHVRFVYDDALAELLDTGVVAVCRVSHVEYNNEKNGWLADMSPVGGPLLGVNGVAVRPHKDCDCDECERVVLELDPFPTRADALAAERAWLTEHQGL